MKQSKELSCESPEVKHMFGSYHSILFLKIVNMRLHEHHKGVTSTRVDGLCFSLMLASSISFSVFSIEFEGHIVLAVEHHKL